MPAAFHYDIYRFIYFVMQKIIERCFIIIFSSRFIRENNSRASVQEFARNEIAFFGIFPG